jgi:hypothetical protein
MNEARGGEESGKLNEVELHVEINKVVVGEFLKWMMGVDCVACSI